VGGSLLPLQTRCKRTRGHEPGQGVIAAWCRPSKLQVNWTARHLLGRSETAVSDFYPMVRGSIPRRPTVTRAAA